MELKITKEKVIKAAESCPDAKKVLEEMFPEAFDGSVEVSRFWFDKSIQVRGDGEFKNRSFFLTTGYNWEIKKDIEGATCLIPTRK